MPLSAEERYRYGIRLSIIYGALWFIDLLDASMLNVALPSIAKGFHLSPTHAEWAIIGFLLAMTIGMSISSWIGSFFGLRKVFLLSQVVYILSSAGCGFAQTMPELIFCRLFQGFAGGIIIPLGMAAFMRIMHQKHWAKIAAKMNMITLLAPAVGPLYAGYVTSLLGWRWLFFIKLPLSILCLILSFIWLRSEKTEKTPLDWRGFLLGGISLSLFLWVFSEIGRSVLSNYTLSILFLLAIVFLVLFVAIERKAPYPLISLEIFKYPLFSFGNVIQSAANVIFLGANFIIALYLQKGLMMDLKVVGWVMAAITPGMLCVMPIVGRFYNHWGPLPFIIPGLIVLGLSILAFIFITSETSPWIIALLIFLEGAASSFVQTANVNSIFSEVPKHLKNAGSSVYSLGKQISASLGVALSTMTLAIALHHQNLSFSQNLPSNLSLKVFHLTFIVLGIIPFLALLCCFYINNHKALKNIKDADHLKTETEYGAE